MAGSTVGGRRAAPARCTYCGGLAHGPLLEADLRGVRYDYCDAACATAHRMDVELTAARCQDCDDDAVGDTGLCAEHLDPVEIQAAGEPATWRRAG